MDKDDLQSRSIHYFLERNNITNDQGEKLDFKDHAFMWDVYSDFSPKLTCMKAAQVTFSTTVSHKVLWLAKYKKMDIIYSLPTGNDVNDFVSGKVNRLIANNPIYQTWTEDKDSIEQKRVGTSTIYYRGTWTDRAALMIPADLYVSDEKDRSKPDIVSAFSSRLQHSKYGWEWSFSNPSSPGNGVDRDWSRSDQKHWFITCEGCTHAQYMTMDNIVKQGDKFIFACVKCRKELNRRKGDWRKKFPGREMSGYWISLLMCPWVSADKVMEYKNTKDEEFFYNFVLGLPFVGKGNVLTKSLLFQNLTMEINAQTDRPIIGVDTGVDIRYVVGNKKGLYYYGQCNDYSELEKMMIKRPDAIMVIDQGGDIIGPRKLRDKFPGRVFLCFYRRDKSRDTIAEWDDKKYTVTADRNKLIQLVVDEFTERRIPIFGTEAEWYDYWLHWSHIYRETETFDDREAQNTWRRSDRDDWVHATCYYRLGMDRFNRGQVDIVQPKDYTSGPQSYEARPDGTGLIFY